MWKTLAGTPSLALAALCVVLCAHPAMCGPGDGTVLGVTRMVDHGPDSQRWDLVIVAEGFTGTQQALFDTRAQEVVDYLFARDPFNAYNEAINVLRLDVASSQSGADDPLECGGSGVYVSTYFDASFCNGGIQRLLVIDDALCISVLNAWTPEWDQAIVIVNSTEYGGSGGQLAVTSVSAGWTGIMVHELGHSGFGLGDEYEYWAGCGYDTENDHHPSYEPAEPNVTTNTNRETVKWTDLIEPATLVPTTINANCAICDPQPNPLPATTTGLYEGAHYYHCDAYRPQFNCRMRTGSWDFCSVCRREVEGVLTPYLPSHVSLSVQSANPASGVTLSVSPPDTNNEGSGSTPFARVYNRLALVSLGAPDAAEGNSFAKWQRDGMDYPGGTNITLSMDKSHTMTAVYLSCTETVGQPWVTPPSPVCINTLYCVVWNRLPGATSYEIRENEGTWESTEGDTSKCYSNSTGGSYSYEVRAVSGCGQGAASLPLTVILESTAPSVPGQPWVDPPSPVCVNTEYIVQWDPVPGTQRYEIRENGSEWLNLGPVTVWYSLKSAAGNYTYEVRALSVCGPSDPSPLLTVTVTAEGASPAIPEQPSVLPPSPVCVSRQYTVRWNPASGAEYYEIRENGDVWRSCGTATMWGVLKSVGGTYSYEVRALNGCGQSGPSPSVTVTVGSCHSLLIYSSNPIDGVPIVVSPLDQDGQGNAPTPFLRTYCKGTPVTLQAPVAFNGAEFLRWLRDGADYSAQPAITFNVDTSHIMTAAFGTCNCPQQGDINGDGYIDVFDVIEAIGVAFSGSPSIQDPLCPKTRSDVNNDGVTDVFDVIYLIDVAFSGGPMPVDPCGP
jgi:hypothetical protein